jgi:peptidoglycan/xylan/chitin deacetylase (PgdA/CDA1 family)
MRFLRNPDIVPVLMFHSVGLHDHPWTWRTLSESMDSFERKLVAMKDKGFTTIFWTDLYDYMAGVRALPRDSILLTFDDGYLDNWVIAYPILKRLGMKATIFVTPDFVDPGISPRPTLDDLGRGCRAQDQMQVAGFLNWAEMRAMESSGLIDIQSHALTHTWYFTSPRIVDFHSPQPYAPYPWLMWNAKPDRKPFYLVEDQQPLVPWGHPIFTHEKALVCRRFFPDERRISDITAHVASNGGLAFFQNPDWRDDLYQLLGRLGVADRFPGHYETAAESETRVLAELSTSKRLLEQHLGKVINYLCWPGGGNDETARTAAISANYRSWTLGSKDPVSKRNLPDTDPTSIRRMNTSNQIKLWGRSLGTGDRRYHMFRIYAHQRSLWHTGLLFAYKLALFATGVRR